MQAHDLFQRGQLTDALRAQSEQVRKSPGDPDARYFLFVLLCFAGELERAGTALHALATQTAHLELETSLLRSLLAAESERTVVWSTEGAPLLGDDPGAHVTARVQAIAALRSGEIDPLEKALDESAEATPTTAGTVNDVAFTALRDDDDVIGSVLELFAGGRYLWLPFERLRTLELAPPRTVLDLLWAPAQLETHDGIQASVHLPVLYTGSHAQSDDGLRLGRQTAWTDLGRGIHRGAGQRMLRCAHQDGEREWPLLEIRRLSCEPASA